MQGSKFNILRALYNTHEKLQDFLPLCEVVAPDISGWTIGQHIDHLNKSNNYNLSKLINPEPNKSYPKRSIRLRGRAVLLIGRIPHGAGKAPKLTVPTEYTESSLRHAIEESKAFITKLMNYTDLSYLPGIVLPHPYFGNLDGRDWIRFLNIHNNHHLKIMNRIAAVWSADFSP